MEPTGGTARGAFKDHIESLSRGLSILSVLAESSAPASLTELARKLQLSKSTMQRMTNTLQRMGYLSRNPETKRFELGPKVVFLGFSVLRNFDLGRLSLPYLQEVSREVGECVSLGILDGPEIVYIARIKTKHLLNLNLQVGSRVPTYSSSMGKAIIAFLFEDRLKEILKDVELTEATPYSIKSKKDLLKQLQLVKKRGFSINNEEISIGVRSVAAPVRDYTGDVIAAVNIAAPSSRVPLNILETLLADKVMETASRISAILGYVP